SLTGPTGSGKSSFICKVTGLSETDVGVGHWLGSCTSDVKAFRALGLPGCSKRVVLVDTPGFDHTSRSDWDILRTISTWLDGIYKRKVLLAGVFHFHPILDGVSTRTFEKHHRLFEQMCGVHAFTRVMLVTTMWDVVEEAHGLQRLNELNETRSRTIKGGALTYRYMNTHDSALDALRQFSDAVGPLDSPRGRVVLELQREMASGMALESTAAGKMLGASVPGTWTSNINYISSWYSWASSYFYPNA
ncbi:hypothetical protein HYDPIDRAFT_98757, partial [Hydnomerulius pinastri MD-312]